MTSLTGRNNRGFSLLELMVVIFIIGLMSAVAVLTLPSRGGEGLLHEERYKLIAALRTARAEAVFSGRSLGFLWTGQRGSFYVLTASGWSPITQGVLNKEVSLDERVRSEITLSGQALDIPSDRGEGERLMTPQFLFLGDGQVSPFEWRLSSLEATAISFDQQLDIDKADSDAP